MLLQMLLLHDVTKRFPIVREGCTYDFMDLITCILFNITSITITTHLRVWNNEQVPEAMYLITYFFRK